MRTDRDQRPELRFGTVDFMAPDGMKSRPALLPSYAFLFDTSQFAITTGLFHQSLTSVKSCLDYLPANSKVTIITFDTAVTFYTLSATEEISVLQVGDTKDPFVPLPLDRLCFDSTEERDRLDIVIDKIYNMFTGEGQVSVQRQKFAN